MRLLRVSSEYASSARLASTNPADLGWGREFFDGLLGVLVDTSVWVDHLRRGNAKLVARLESGEVLTHPFVVGELACGHLSNRQRILSLLEALRSAPVAEHGEVLAFVDAHRLSGKGIGWIDVHLLASARLANTRLWTLDRKLAAVAKALRTAAE